MWPFRQKTLREEIKPKTFKSILCIPGNWETLENIKELIFVNNGGEYMIVGDILMDVKRECHYTIEFCERDERIRRSFAAAGSVTRISEEVLAAIEKHTYVIYITGLTGNMQEAERLAFAGNAIIKAGGSGIKIETTGKAFETNRWSNLLENFEPSNLYKMFVVDSIANNEGSVYSCGMQNLGYKDTIITGEEFQESVDLISLFSYYQIIDKPTMIANQTFSASKESPVYKITEEPNQPYKEDELFGNPFGMWRLTKL